MTQDKRVMQGKRKKYEEGVQIVHRRIFFKV